jgi:hypothetical protein
VDWIVTFSIAGLTYIPEPGVSALLLLGISCGILRRKP